MIVLLAFGYLALFAFCRACGRANAEAEMVIAEIEAEER